MVNKRWLVLNKYPLILNDNGESVMSCNPTELKWKCNTPTVSGPQLLLPWVPLTQISVLEKLLAKAEYAYRTGCNGSFTLKETDSHTDSDSDSKLKQYIVACRTCWHCADKDSDPYSLFFIGQESESETVPERVSGNVNKLYAEPSVLIVMTQVVCT